MKKYFTISEFAKLRNININSLRYYEKIGVLKPIILMKKPDTDTIRRNKFLFLILFFYALTSECRLKNLQNISTAVTQ